MAQELEEVRERTLVICFEDLSSPDHDVETISTMLDFWYNGRQHRHWNGTPPGHSDPRGHKTSHNPAVRERLKILAQEIDETYYHRQIEWAHKTLPCQKLQQG